MVASALEMAWKMRSSRWCPPNWVPGRVEPDVRACQVVVAVGSSQKDLAEASSGRQTMRQVFVSFFRWVGGETEFGAAPGPRPTHPSSFVS